LPTSDILEFNEKKEHVELVLDVEKMHLEQFQLEDGDPALRVRGIALTEGEWNKIWFSEDALRKGVEKLCPGTVCHKLQLRANHTKDVWDIVGLVNEFRFDPAVNTEKEVKSGIRFEAEIRLKEAVERVNKGLWGPVSVGVYGDLHRVKVEESGGEDEEGPKYRIEARNLDFEHLAWVTSAGCKDAKMTEILNHLDDDAYWLNDGGEVVWGDTIDSSGTTSIWIGSTVQIDNDDGENTTEEKEPKETINEVDNASVKTVAEEENEQPEEVQELEEADEGEDAGAETVGEQPDVEALKAELEDLKKAHDALQSKGDEQQTLIDTLVLNLKQPEEETEEITEAEEESEEEADEETEDEGNKVQLIEQIVAIDPSLSKDDLEESDYKSLDTLLNYLVRTNERQSVKGKGVVGDDADKEEGTTLDKMEPKEITKAMCQYRSNAWVLGQMMASLFTKRKSKEEFEEI
jgi:hypothetical protein